MCRHDIMRDVASAYAARLRTAAAGQISRQFGAHVEQTTKRARMACVPYMCGACAHVVYDVHVQTSAAHGVTCTHTHRVVNPRMHASACALARERAVVYTGFLFVFSAGTRNGSGGGGGGGGDADDDGGGVSSTRGLFVRCGEKKNEGPMLDWGEGSEKVICGAYRIASPNQLRQITESATKQRNRHSCHAH